MTGIVAADTENRLVDIAVIIGGAQTEGAALT